jgi:Zn-dependent protease with chaperone function
MKKTASIFAFGLVLAGCAAPTTRPTIGTAGQVDSEVKYQRELAARHFFDNYKKLNSVSSKLRVSAVDLCEKNVKPVFGFLPIKPTNDDNGALMRRIHNVGDQVSILDVVDGLPFSLAGLRQGDVILAIGGKTINEVVDVSTALDATQVSQPVEIQYLRANEKKTVVVAPVSGCFYPAKLTVSTDINAFADGKGIVITQGMMNFTKTEEELALVVSHEIAHNMMKHIDAKKTNAFGGLLADIAVAIATRGAYRDSSMANAAAQAYSQEFESEADYVGLYIMAKAGYKIEDAPNFWRRMAVAHPSNIKTNHTASHPSTASRMVALDAAVAEIKSKQAAKAPLVPNLKEVKLASEKPQ